MSSKLPEPTERLRFREMTMADLDVLAGLLGDPQVMTYYPEVKSRDQAAAWIQRNRQRYAEDGFGLWIIETHSGEFLGDCGLTWQNIGGRRDLEVGYHVHREQQGRGFATEAARACRDFAWQLGFQRLTANIHTRNAPPPARR
ncbi:GNAT family N-acetyltransferase [Acaricomes phytoseiuli]|uniref:GNAT family N-acetyltransferase n=1 Tax=Acaricomes phytoseiuli TaxID=291968 RepID=UPI002222D4A0|nr:GNAT family N-acetyltransferase [Acaricomes phytoseiuli]MCW1250030.1 GNAT family N-acetyltransferase [Acaricomes phytoseiuli]